MYCSVVDRESWPLSVTPDKKNLSHLELTTSFNENVEDQATRKEKVKNEDIMKKSGLQKLECIITKKTKNNFSC